MFQQDTGRLDRSSEAKLLLFSILSFMVLAASHLVIAHRCGWPALLGDRSEAIFDLWSLQHFCAGILLGSLLLRGSLRCGTSWNKLALVAFWLALLWEAAELAMEAGVCGHAVADWKGGFEHWSNRLVGDPLMVTGGALLARRLPRAWKVVLLPAALWLLLNVLSPNSMSIQRWLFG